MKRILSIVKKDFKQISRNKFMGVITFLAIFFYALIYWILPAKVDESFKIGLYLEKGREAVEEQLSQEKGIEVRWADSEDKLKELVEEKKVEAGFSFTTPFKEPIVKLYFSSQTPEEIREAGEVLSREFAYMLLGFELPIEVEETIIEPDMIGQQIPLRNKMRVLFLTFVLVVEIFALANLLMEEVQKKTVQALLVTPVNISEFMSAKAIVGISLAFFEGVLAALLLRLINIETFFAIIIFLFLGSVLATSLAFIVGATSRDFSSLMGWGMLVMLILIIPAIQLIFPAAASPWLEAIPTHHMIQALDGIVNYNLSLSDYLPQITYLFSFALFFFLAGFFIFRRRLV